ALMAVLSSPYLHPKFAVAVDEDVDPSDVDQILWAIATRSHAARDVQRWDATRVFALDNASPVERARFAIARPPQHATAQLADYLLQTRPADAPQAPDAAPDEQSIRPLLQALERAGALQTIIQTVDPRATLAALVAQLRGVQRAAGLFDSLAGHFGW